MAMMPGRNNPNVETFGEIEESCVVELSGIKYTRREYHGQHMVFDRVAPDPVLETRPEVRIVPVGDGVRVDFGDVVGRVFADVWHVDVVNGKPLYRAALPESQCDFWTEQTVVWGTTEYYGAEMMQEIVCVAEGEPIIIGHTHEDPSYYSVIHARRHALMWHRISHEYFVECGMLVYAGISGGGLSEPPYEWYAAIGGTKFGPYDTEPSFRRHAYDTIGNYRVAATRIEIAGLRNGRPSHRSVDMRRLVEKTNSIKLR